MFWLYAGMGATGVVIVGSYSGQYVASRCSLQKPFVDLDEGSHFEGMPATPVSTVDHNIQVV